MQKSENSFLLQNILRIFVFFLKEITKINSWKIYSQIMLYMVFGMFAEWNLKLNYLSHYLVFFFSFLYSERSIWCHIEKLCMSHLLNMLWENLKFQSYFRSLLKLSLHSLFSTFCLVNLIRMSQFPLKLNNDLFIEVFLCGKSC